MIKGYISVIIPVYNCENYLSKCLESVIHQTYDKLEIILINDGSTDQTDRICKDYAAKDLRINYLTQSNHGVAYARKRAVEKARGEYVGFVDADDHIDENMYELLQTNLGDADLVTSGFIYQGKKMYDAIPGKLYHTEKEIKYLHENMFLFEKSSESGITPNLVNKLFLTEKLKATVKKVATDIFIGEDADVVYKYILSCNSIFVSDICAYHYECHNESAVHSVNYNYLNNWNNLYLSLKKEIERVCYKELIIPKLNRWVWLNVQYTPQFMGWDFAQDIKPIKYLSTYFNLLIGKKIVLYGAGVVGWDFYRLHQKTRDLEIVLWVDKNWKRFQDMGWEVCPIKQIDHIAYDYILIAVKEKEKAEEIKKQLMEQGISCSKILWKEPISLSPG